MKKILGLDIGVASIGWAIVELSDDNQHNSILGIGSRIIPLSADENNEFTRGNEQTTNANRRMKRGARRNLQRYSLRKDQLKKALAAMGLFPDPELFQMDTLSLYGLRAKAVYEKISPGELGRLLFMLNQKRGYKSNRKVNKEEEQATESRTAERTIPEAPEEAPTKQRKKGYLELIADREALLQEQGITIGEFCYNGLKADHHFAVKNKIFLRSSYMKEFDLIWEKQKEFYPEILTDHRYNQIRNTIIYYQRPLKSQKALVADCRFEKQHKCAPKSSPLFQSFKIWQDINNLKINSYRAYKGIEPDEKFKGARERDLELEEKILLFNSLATREKLTKKEVLLLLGYKGQAQHYDWTSTKDLEGNRTWSALAKVFNKHEIDKPALLDFHLESTATALPCADTETGEIRPRLVIDPAFEQQNLYQLWHLLYSVDEPSTLQKTLVEKYQMTESQAIALASIDFTKAGYGSLSARAIRKILPYMMEGKMYDKACLMAGYRHSDYLMDEENAERQLEDKLELIKKGHLRNPVVEKIINHTINLVNAILEHPDYGKPDEIRVELARELTQNAEQRNNAFQKNTETDKYHKRIVEILQQELGFKKVSRNDIERYKLWQEFNQLSPYRPSSREGVTYPIKLSEVYNGSYDVDHIIPQSRVFDDSFQNKVLCTRQINQQKGNMTAYDYMQSLGEETLKSYVEFVTQAYQSKKITKAKFTRLTMPAKEIPEDFINRQLNESQYIARKVLSLLSTVCRHVRATSGTVTAYQRFHWGYEQITQSLNWERFEAIGETTIETLENGQRVYRIDNWSKREDHRHHAIDALVIASTRQSTIQRLNNLNQLLEARQNESKMETLKESDKLGVKDYVTAQCPFTQAEVEKAVAGILVSFKAGKRVSIQNKNLYKYRKGEKIMQNTMTPRGYLHKESVYGRIREIEKIKLTTRFSNMDKIAYPEAKAYLLAVLEQAGYEPGKAFSAKALAAMLAELSAKPVPGIHTEEGNILISCFRESFVLRYPLGSLKASDIPSVVDPVVRNILAARIEALGEKQAFKDLEKNPVWFNQEKGLQIKSVRLHTGNTGLVPLHRAKDGQTRPAGLLPDGKEVDYVVTRNNHHIALYRDENGKIVENAVTFWDALLRKKHGLPVVIKKPSSVLDHVLAKNIETEELLRNLPGPGWQFITSLQQNELFANLGKDEVEQLVREKRYDVLSKHLFRVQQIASKYYVFRFHLETKVEDNSLSGQKSGKYLRIRSLDKFTLTKVVLNTLGQVVRVGEP